MNYIGEIFLFSIAITLVFSGMMKIIWYKNTIESIKKIGIFPMRISGGIAIAMPLFEVLMATLIFICFNKIVAILIIAYVLFFISINLKFVLEKRTIKCCCYGKAMESNLGKGGLIHYVYLLSVFAIGFICKLNNELQIVHIKSINNGELMLMLIVAMLLMINGIFIRILIKNMLNRKDIR